MTEPAETIVTVYVIRYCLTQGIFKREGSIDLKGYFSYNPGSIGSMLLSKSEYRLTWDEAIEAAEAMRVAKIASLNKSIAKLEKLRFENP